MSKNNPPSQLQPKNSKKNHPPVSVVAPDSSATQPPEKTAQLTDMPKLITATEINKIFNGSWRNIGTFMSLEKCPPAHHEVAFFGKSNVGKSSFINAVTLQSRLARISSNPGCTSGLKFLPQPQNRKILPCRRSRPRLCQAIQSYQAKLAQPAQRLLQQSTWLNKTLLPQRLPPTNRQ